MPSSSSKHTRTSSGSSIRSKPSKQASGHHRRLSHSSGSSGSPPKSVVIILPAQMQPPIAIKAPSHRTAVPAAPALISRSVSATAAIPPTRSRPIAIPQQRMPIHGSSGGDPNVIHYRPSGSPSSPSNLATYTPDYTYTITPVSRSASNSSPLRSSFHSARGTVSSSCEDDYYNHPAVRAYELQKAAEQARWTRRMMHERETSASRMMQQQQHVVGSSPPGYQPQRW